MYCNLAKSYKIANFTEKSVQYKCYICRNVNPYVLCDNIRHTGMCNLTLFCQNDKKRRKENFKQIITIFLSIHFQSTANHPFSFC